MEGVVVGPRQLCMTSVEGTMVAKGCKFVVIKSCTCSRSVER
jgi:hypothetical protein